MACFNFCGSEDTCHDLASEFSKNCQCDQNEISQIKCDSPRSAGVSRSISKKHPTHYTLKIDSFSLLLKNSIERYESREFEAGGYKWYIYLIAVTIFLVLLLISFYVSLVALRNLVIHPNGNKTRNVKEHLSLYLAMAGSNCLRLGWEVYAVVRLFIFDQNNDNYMILQDGTGKERRFHEMEREWGFDQFLPLKAFNDTGKGFLMDDTCVFGAEVFISKERVRDQGECLRMIKDPIAYKHTFKVNNFSKLGTEIDSNEFTSGDQKWKIRLWPNGKGAGLGTHLSVYLVLVDPTSLSPGSKMYVEYTLRILNQANSNHVFSKASNWFSASSEQHGWLRYMTISYFKNSGFLLKDIGIIEAEIAIHGIIDDL